MDTLVLLLSFAVFCAIGVPVAYSLGLAAIATALWTDIPLEAVMIKTSDGVGKFSLLAIPFFVTTGALMAEGGTARRLVALAQVFVGFIRGGLAMVNVVAQTLFGCISGSSVADTASIGSVMIPQMIKQGYPRVFATNVTICGSLQAILLPPSHNSVIYALAAGGSISIAHLFLAGISPGLLLGLSILVLVMVIAHRRDFPRGETVTVRQALKIAADAIWGLMTVVIILGGILSGVFTATESASIAVIYALLMTTLVYRSLSWENFLKASAKAVKTTGIILLLIGISATFGYLISLYSVADLTGKALAAVSTNPWMIFFLVNLILFILGTFLDMAATILICTPIFLPICQQFGMDPVQFGMVMLINCALGLNTPPVGTTQFVGCAIGGVSIGYVMRTIWPFYGALIAALMLVTYVPAFSLWLPRAFGYLG
jgi:tripartite ATP-independent transporter DctM subunit